MSRSLRLSPNQSAVVLAVLVAVACATQTVDAPTDSLSPDDTGAIGGDTGIAGMPMNGGTNPTGSGGTNMGGTGGTSMGAGGTATGTGGASMGGTGATAGKATGGTGAGGAGTGGSTAKGGTGGTLGGAGKATGGTSGTSSLFGGSAGTTARGGTGGTLGAGGRGSGGTSAAGRGAGGTAAGGRTGGFGGGAGTTVTGSGGMSTADCITTLAKNTQSGDLGKDASCYDISGTMMGYQVSNLGSRTFTINGEPPPAGGAVPAADASGHRIFAFGTADGSTAQPTYTTWSWW